MTDGAGPFDAFLADLAHDRHYRGQIVEVKSVPPRDAVYADPADPLPVPLTEGLAKMGIARLYAHQAEALDRVRAGRDVVVVTATASGKTMAYNLPVMERLLEDPMARALYLFPTKALARDQLGTLERWKALHPALASALRPATYDGDTPRHNRRKIREDANVILSNPDMMHVGILPYHPRWATFLQNLRYVVVDELHQYRGIFGSNVAMVVRRLARVCAHYGSRPRFIGASATIANPGALAEDLLGRPCATVENDGAPRGPRLFVLWNPPLFGDDPLTRRSANLEATDLLVRLMERGVQTIVFTRARVVAELVYRYAREQLERRDKALVQRLRAYRGGYLPQDRREIEQALFTGKLLGVATTNALELGIDVGSLDASILVGFPGTIASTLQQSGRAGRGQEQALTVLIAYNDPVDQYLMHHPEYLFGRPVEHGVIDPANPYILASHLGCGAAELPLAPEDAEVFGPATIPVADALAADGRLTRIEDRYYWSTTDTPSHRTDLRTISNDTFTIVRIDAAKPQVLGQVDAISAPELVYPNAIYLHEGESFQVKELDFEGKVAYIQRAETDYYTQPVLADKCRIVAERIAKAARGATVRFGDLDVTWATIAFKKIKYHSNENIGQTALDLPSQTLRTTGLWLTPDREIMDDLRAAGLKAVEGLVGVRNLMLVCLPMLAMCDRKDLSGICESSQVGRPTAFVYDRFPGGLGFAEKGYELLDELLGLCLRLVAECPCEEGCPSCVGLANLRPPLHQDPDLSHGYAIPSKEAAMLLLARLEA